ncbi:hypothetical protein ACFL2Q_07760 [Thermodesulfobacteriota bacterium]
MQPVSEFRIRKCNESPPNAHGDYVLYWMIANRRAQWNFGLQRAVEWTDRLGKTLVVFEALRCGYKWASDRLHSFIIDGMRDNKKYFSESSVLYYPYLEPDHEASKGLLKALSAQACCVVTDDFPCFFLPRMVSAAAEQITVLLEAVDSNGILPIKWTDKVFTTAYSFRRFLQKNLDPHLHAFPERDPLNEFAKPGLKRLPREIIDRWPPAERELCQIKSTFLETFPIDHTVRPSPIRGGSKAGKERLESFLDFSLAEYAESRNHPDSDCASGLSPYRPYFRSPGFQGTHGPRTLDMA